MLPCRLKPFTESLLFTSTGSDTAKGSSQAVCVGDSEQVPCWQQSKGNTSSACVVLCDPFIKLQ